MSGSKIAAKLNIPAGLVFVLLKKVETVQLPQRASPCWKWKTRVGKDERPWLISESKSGVLSKVFRGRLKVRVQELESTSWVACIL